jgi:hypothetical protein
MYAGLTKLVSQMSREGHWAKSLEVHKLVQLCVKGCRFLCCLFKMYRPDQAGEPNAA